MGTQTRQGVGQANATQTHGAAVVSFPFQSPLTHRTAAALARAPATQQLLRAFAKSTGWDVQLVPAHGAVPPAKPPAPVTVCQLLAQHPNTGAKCRCVRAALLGKVLRKKSAQRIPCSAGLTELGVPVFAHNQHIATLVCSRICSRPVPARIIAHVVQQLKQSRTVGAARQPYPGPAPLRAAYRRVPIIPVHVQQAHRQLLELVADKLGDMAQRLLLTDHGKVPDCVHKAKDYVGKNLATKLTRRVVAKHVGLCPYRFGQLFQQSTGLTLPQYVRACRVERAKELLRDPGRKIVDIAFEAGFQSHATFYRAFRQLTGQSAAEYRRSATTAGVATAL